MYQRYYLIPRTFERELKELAYGSESDGSAFRPLQLDMAPLVQSLKGQETMAIQTAIGGDGEAKLEAIGSRSRVWKLKEGLSEDEDFMYLSEEGWEKLVSL